MDPATAEVLFEGVPLAGTAELLASVAVETILKVFILSPRRIPEWVLL